jgi:hypothetical protein
MLLFPCVVITIPYFPHSSITTGFSRLVPLVEQWPFHTHNLPMNHTLPMLQRPSLSWSLDSWIYDQAITTYHHYSSEFEFRSWHGVLATSHLPAQLIEHDDDNDGRCSIGRVWFIGRLCVCRHVKAKQRTLSITVIPWCYVDKSYSSINRTRRKTKNEFKYSGRVTAPLVVPVVKIRW